MVNASKLVGNQTARGKQKGWGTLCGGKTPKMGFETPSLTHDAKPGDFINLTFKPNGCIIRQWQIRPPKHNEFFLGYSHFT